MKGKLTEGTIWKQLLRLGLPMYLAMNGFVFFNIVDNHFIGKLSLKALAAFNYTPTIVMVMFAIAFGLGTGATAIIGEAAGEGNHKKIQNFTTHSLILAVVLSLVLTVVGYPTIDILFSFLGANEELTAIIHSYMELWFLGIFLIIVPIVGNSAIRAMGNTLIPSIIMWISVGTNILLDPIFIFGWWGFPEWGLFGASFATFLARIFTFVAALLVLHFKYKLISFKGFSLRSMFQSWSKVLSVGGPSIIGQLIIPAAILIITRLASSQENHEHLVAAIGSAAKIEFAAISIIASLGAVLVPFIAQNIGARNFDRVNKGVVTAAKFAIIWGAISTVLFVLLRDIWGPMFKADEPIFIEMMSDFFLIIPFSFAFRMVFITSTSSLNAYQKASYTSWLTFLQLGIIYIPLAYWFTNLWGYTGIFYALFIANLVSGLAAYIIERKQFKTLKSRFV